MTCGDRGSTCIGAVASLWPPKPRTSATKEHFALEVFSSLRGIAYVRRSQYLSAAENLRKSTSAVLLIESEKQNLHNSVRVHRRGDQRYREIFLEAKTYAGSQAFGRCCDTETSYTPAHRELACRKCDVDVATYASVSGSIAPVDKASLQRQGAVYRRPPALIDKLSTTRLSPVALLAMRIASCKSQSL